MSKSPTDMIYDSVKELRKDVKYIREDVHNIKEQLAFYKGKAAVIGLIAGGACTIIIMIVKTLVT